MKNGDNSREGYESHNENNGKTGHTGGHRQRFTRTARPASTGYSRNSEGGNSYSSRYNEGGYQGRSYNRNGNADGSSRSYNSYNNRLNNEGEYRPHYGQGGYQPRDNRWGKSRFPQSNEEGGYKSYASRGNSYNPRYANERSEEYGNRKEGFRPRYNASEQGGYAANDAEFRPRRNASRPNNYGQQGGYRQGGYRQGKPSYNANGSRGNYNPHAKYGQKKRLEYKEENYDPTMPIRLNKYLSNAGVCSRRDADKYIEAGVVTVNGQVVTELGAKVLRTDEVKFHDTPVKIEKKVYVLLNKPKDYVTTSDDPQNRKTVMDLVKDACPERIYPVGRLDRNTTGVLLLTNDGEMASKLTHPKYLKKKIYHVQTDHNVSAADLRQIAEGITLDDGEIKADAVEYASETDKKQIGIEIHSGKNRIVRRIFESLGYHVVKLDRVYFAGLTKKNVRRGDWRYLTEKEVQMLRMGAFE